MTTTGHSVSPRAALAHFPVKGLVAALGFLALLTFAPAARASILYSVNDGSGHSATASFTFGTNTLTLVLANTNGNIQDANNLLTALNFGLSAGTGMTLASSSASHITIGSGGSVTNNGVSATGWSFTLGSPDHLEFAAPNTGIIGPGPYTSANSSITNGTHSPFLAGNVTFNFTFTSGVNSSTTLSSVPVFIFGTNLETSVSSCTGDCGGGGGTQATPEPISFLLVGTGLVGAYFFRRRKT